MSGGVCIGGCVSWGVRGGVCTPPDPEAHTPLDTEAHTALDPEVHTLPCGQTDACENITLPQTSFSGGNKDASSVYQN